MVDSKIEQKVLRFPIMSDPAHAQPPIINTVVPHCMTNRRFEIFEIFSQSGTLNDIFLKLVAFTFLRFSKLKRALRL